MTGGRPRGARSIDEGGERVSHLYPNDLYFAHLSLYAFALRHARASRVLDAGCGAGFGAAYLADHGARAVHAVDRDDEAVAFCRAHFARANIAFDVLDVQDAPALPDGGFDLVVCSNTLEHVPDVAAALRSFWRVLGPGGRLVLAVPPVVDARARAFELLNPFHLHVWPPDQWRAVLGRYFAVVTAFAHRCRPGVHADFLNRPAETSIRETDFVFEALPAAAATSDTLTALFVAERPAALDRLPPLGWSPPLSGDAISRPPLPDARRRAGAVTPAALAPGRPLGALPGRAWCVLRRGGVGALVADVRRYVDWQAQRRRARRVLADAAVRPDRDDRS